MQMPTPPVSQCKIRHTTNPDQEKKPGMNARRAPTCKAPIQRTGVQANEAPEPVERSSSSSWSTFFSMQLGGKIRRGTSRDAESEVRRRIVSQWIRGRWNETIQGGSHRP